MPERDKTQTVQPDPNLACENCGRFGAYIFDGKRLCLDCYENSGSCCPEFGGDDKGREMKNEL